MRARSLFLPVFSGAGLWLSFPDPSVFFLAWITLIPFLLFCIEKRSFWELTAGHLLLSCIYFGGVLYWITRVLTIFGNLPWVLAAPVFLLLVLILGFLLFPFTYLTNLVARNRPRLALVCAPGFWLATELLRNFFPFNGFPWGSLGYSQFPFKTVIQIADLGSVYLVSFLVVAINCGLAGFIKFKQSKPLVISLVLFVLGNVYGAYRLYWWSAGAEERVTVALVQPNIELAQSREYYAEKYFEDLPRLFEQAVESGARLVVFPEAQNPYFFPQDFYFKSFWEARVRSGNVYLLFNSASLAEDKSRGYFNSAHLLAPDGASVFRYDKIRLVPFGEYLPLRNFLGFAKPLVAEVSSFRSGTRAGIGKVSGIEFAVLVCYEAIFPNLSRDVASRGAKFLTNLTNDRWFGTTAAPTQHLEMAACRAIENRLPMARAANSGFTAVISPLGEIQNRTKLDTEALVVAELTTSLTRSLYTSIGDWPCIAIIILTFVGAFTVRTKS